MDGIATSVSLSRGRVERNPDALPWLLPRGDALFEQTDDRIRYLLPVVSIVLLGRLSLVCCCRGTHNTSPFCSSDDVARTISSSLLGCSPSNPEPSSGSPPRVSSSVSCCWFSIRLLH